MYLQTTFWLRVYTLNGKISITEPFYVSSELTEMELKDYCFDDMKKVNKIKLYNIKLTFKYKKYKYKYSK